MSSPADPDTIVIGGARIGPDDAAVLTLYALGQPVDVIAHDTGLTPAEITHAITAARTSRQWAAWLVLKWQHRTDPHVPPQGDPEPRAPRQPRTARDTYPPGVETLARRWAEKSGIVLPPRGRISRALLAEYRSATTGEDQK